MHENVAFYMNIRTHGGGTYVSISCVGIADVRNSNAY